MSGVDSSVILVNLTNDTKIANKAIVTGISSSGTQSPSQGNVHHMIMPASNGNWYISTVDRKSTRLNSSHDRQTRMPSSA